MISIPVSLPNVNFFILEQKCNLKKFKMVKLTEKHKKKKIIKKLMINKNKKTLPKDKSNRDVNEHF